jgi:excisionase family DNA binding protein
MLDEVHVTKEKNQSSVYVNASYIAKKLAVTSRYILNLAEAGKIPSIRISFKVIRFNLADVEKALGVNLTKGDASL